MYKAREDQETNIMDSLVHSEKSPTELMDDNKNWDIWRSLTGNTYQQWHMMMMIFCYLNFMYVLIPSTGWRQGKGCCRQSTERWYECCVSSAGCHWPWQYCEAEKLSEGELWRAGCTHKQCWSCLSWGMFDCDVIIMIMILFEWKSEDDRAWSLGSVKCVTKTPFTTIVVAAAGATSAQEQI